MSAMNLKVGDCVHYGAHGVCRVCGRESKDFGGHPRAYFALRPTGNENILLYLPEDAQAEQVKIRKLLSKEEILKLIHGAGSLKVGWIADSKSRREAWTKILRGGEAGDLIGMLKAIYTHRQTLPEGKQLPMSDLDMMHAAQRQLHSEMAYVLSIEEDQVLPFILGTIHEDEENLLRAGAV